MWAGGQVKVTRDILAATDADTPSDRLTFSPVDSAQSASSDCGVFSLRSRPSVPAKRFTQADINNGRIIFTHMGKSSTMSYV